MLGKIRTKVQLIFAYSNFHNAIISHILIIFVIMKETLRRYWGYDSFRPMQEEIIRSALNGKDTLAILPTGGGKSICFQLPAMMREGICIVISPLIALMKDQVENLRKRGISALVIHSGMTYHEIDVALDNAVYGDYKFLYISPERLRSQMFKVRIAKMNVSFLVVDEAHCISQWGYDFRPDYLEIAGIKNILSSPAPTIALTATATEKVSADIMRLLDFQEPNLIKSSFQRDNLSYIFRKTEDKMSQLLKVCRGIKGCGIVYVSKRRTAEDLASFLQAHDISAEGYHAGMSQIQRNTVQDNWKSDKTRIIVSTNAFGMGIDKPEVRFVCHYDLPEAMEYYFQEAGRAGRDGKDSYCILLWNESDIQRMNTILKTTFPPLEYIKDIYQKVFSFVGYSYEEGAGACVKFNIEEFAQRFRLHTATAYYAIKYIELSGYWTLTETVQIPARLQFIVSRDQLYRIQLGSIEMDTFVKLLMRMYTGLFSEYTSIDLEKIAKIGRYSPEAIKEKLRQLSRMDVVKYIPPISSPMLNIVNERLYEKNLRLPADEYNKRISMHKERLDAMISAVRNSTECRSIQMLRYFGEVLPKPCCKCDICRAVSQSGPDDKKSSDYDRLMKLKTH